MSDVFYFAGHDVAYWLDLDRRFKSAVPDGPQLLAEIVHLRGHLSFHESRIKDMHKHLSGEPK